VYRLLGRGGRGEYSQQLFNSVTARPIVEIRNNVLILKGEFLLDQNQYQLVDFTLRFSGRDREIVTFTVCLLLHRS